MAKKANKIGKRMAMGGTAMNSGVAAMTPRRGRPVSRQDIKNAVARPMPSPGPGMPMRPPMMRPEVMPGAGVAPMPRGGMRGGMRMAAGGRAGGTKTNEPVGRGGMGGSSSGGVSGGIRGGGRGRGGPAGGVTTGSLTGNVARNAPSRPATSKPAVSKPKAATPTFSKPAKKAIKAPAEEPVEGYTPPDVPDEVLPAPPRRGLSFKYSTKLGPGMSLGNYMMNPTAFQSREGRTRRGLKGGGLAKKGVGMALAKGGMVKGAGCAKRGVKKPEYK